MRSALSCRIAMSVLGLVLAAGPVLAQTAPEAPSAGTEAPNVSPEKLALARAVIDSTGAMRSFDPVLSQILADARRTVLATNPDVAKDLDASLAIVQKELAPRRQELHDRIAALYAGHFTEAELRKLVQFYESPVGKKMVEVTPEILRQSYGVVQDWAQKLSFDVMAKLREEMKKKGHDI